MRFQAVWSYLDVVEILLGGRITLATLRSEEIPELTPPVEEEGAIEIVGWHLGQGKIIRPPRLVLVQIVDAVDAFLIGTLLGLHRVLDLDGVVKGACKVELLRLEKVVVNVGMEFQTIALFRVRRRVMVPRGAHVGHLLLGTTGGAYAGHAAHIHLVAHARRNGMNGAKQART